MIDIKTYLNSGIIENYCLGVASPKDAQQLEAYVDQYPEIRKELEAAQDALIHHLDHFKIEAPDGLEEKILHQIENDQLKSAKIESKSGLLPEFINISPDSDVDQWKTLIKDIHPPAAFDVHVHPLFDQPDRQLYIAWFKGEIPDEVHNDLLESIFILEGTCVGILEENRYDLGPGDYVKVPLHTHHSLIVTSESPVKLILSRVLTA